VVLAHVFIVLIILSFLVKDIQSIVQGLTKETAFEALFFSFPFSASSSDGPHSIYMIA
jgi:hypothetical protein